MRYPSIPTTPTRECQRQRFHDDNQEEKDDHGPRRRSLGLRCRSGDKEVTTMRSEDRWRRCPEKKTNNLRMRRRRPPAASSEEEPARAPRQEVFRARRHQCPGLRRRACNSSFDRLSFSFFFYYFAILLVGLWHDAVPLHWLRGAGGAGRGGGLVVIRTAAASSSWPTRVTGHGSRSASHRQRQSIEEVSAADKVRVEDDDLRASDGGGVEDAGPARCCLKVRILRNVGGDSATALEVRRIEACHGGTLKSSSEGNGTAVDACDSDGAIVSLGSDVDGDDGALRIQAIAADDTWSRRVRHDSVDNDGASVDVEGLFGVYRVPSGRLWVWIAESELVYRAPPWWRGSGAATNPNWFEIRRATRLHVLHQPYSSAAANAGSPSSFLAPSLQRAQRLEEMRQLSLLRRSLKLHDWYFCGTSEPPPLGNIRRNDSNTDQEALTVACPFVPDMTVNLQAALLGRIVDSDSSVSSTSQPWWERPSGSQSTSIRRPISRFFWNEALLEELVHLHELEETSSESRQACEFLLQHAIPVTSAFCGVQRNVPIPNSNIQGSPQSSRCYDHLLVTRRSRFRAGTRFTKRGADHTGAVANYAETEQIVLIHDGGDDSTLHTICSHAQTRGSIPLRWSSPTDIKTYRPRVRIGTDPVAQARAVRHHVVDQMTTYVLPRHQTEPRNIHHPELVFVNLVDKKSDQGRLGRAFDAVLKSVIDVYAAQDSSSVITNDHNASPVGNSSYSVSDRSLLPLNFSNVQHIWYDFHAEVKHGRWGRLSQLLSQIERCQSGIVRTNCMDCLDRTNVVQGMLGRFLLFRQLSDSKLLSLPLKTAYQANPLSLPWEEGEIAHRHLWADNADAISRLYAGTPALKGDFTRTGRRTKRGALDDGMNSLQRYYLNNFQDADRQEGVDLLVGFQPFNVVSNDTDAYNLQDKREGSSSFPAVSLHEAAHRAVLGPEFGYDAGDGNHVRIKVPRRRRSGTFALLSPRSPPSLDLRWLPGDLQTQMRGAMSPEVSYAPPFMLQSLEARSQLELPWWVTSGSHSDEEDTWAQDQSVVDAEVAAINNPGYLMGAVVAGSQSPFMMATVVLAILVSALPSTSSKANNSRSSIDASGS